MTNTTSQVPKPTDTKRRPRRRQGPRIKGGASREARRRATCILEVLGGARSPTEAAKELDISVPRYYLLESRSLQGLVTACEPRPKGKVPSMEHELEQAHKDLEQLRRECARYAALVRAAQRTIGLSGPPPRPKAKVPGKGKGRRRPVARALKAVAQLKVEDTPSQSEPSSA